MIHLLNINPQGFFFKHLQCTVQFLPDFWELVFYLSVVCACLESSQPERVHIPSRGVKPLIRIFTFF